MEVVNLYDPVILKVIGLSVTCWFSGFATGKFFSFVSEIFRKATRSR